MKQYGGPRVAHVWFIPFFFIFRLKKPNLIANFFLAFFHPVKIDVLNVVKIKLLGKKKTTNQQTLDLEL